MKAPREAGKKNSTCQFGPKHEVEMMSEASEFLSLTLKLFPVAEFLKPNGQTFGHDLKHKPNKCLKIMAGLDKTLVHAGANWYS